MAGINMMLDDSLSKEAGRATELLRGKEVATVWRHRRREVGIEFTDGTRFFVDWKEDGVELSITGGREEEVSK
jgi:hypothetical protein